MRLSRGWILVLLALAPVAFISAQTLEDDDPNDRRYWGYSSRYQSQINALGETPATSLPIPVLLGVEPSDLTKNFGDPRGDGTRTHEGLDIMAPQGTPIASPTDAVVVRTGNGASSGIYVRTGNPGGENYVYMHLLAIAKGIEQGKSVSRGEIIGFVGSTGNASGGPAHLHFEIRKNGAIDPYPRLTQFFTLTERMQGVTQALERSADPAALAAMLATKFKSTFVSAQSQSIAIPQSIASQLPANGSNGTNGNGSSTGTGIPARQTLVFGENNADIVTLQKFLIASPQGSAGQRLKNTGATGYFGPLTRDALIEYQRFAKLTPSGVVDDATYTHIFALQSEGDSSGTAENGNGNESAFTRDLELGMTGEDVRALQKFLNTHGFIITSSGVGSLGNESNYFGSLTRAALAKYQSANGISPAAGYFGPKTRAHISTHQ